MQRIFIVITALLAAINLSALELNDVKPGGLSAMVTAPGSVVSLSINGQIDARDMQFIATKMTSLRSLDMSGASIDAYKGDVEGLDAKDFAAAHIPATVFAGSSIETVAFPRRQAVTVGDMAFMGSAVSSLDFATSVAALGQGAFSACRNLKTVDTGTLEVIGRHAFAECVALTSVALNGAVNLGSDAFAGCAALSEVTGAETLVTIGDNAFAGCSSLTSFFFGSGLATVGAQAFAATGLTKADLSQCHALTAIGDFAFAKCSDLADISFPESLKTLGRGVLFDDASITTLQLPDALSEINDYSLKGLDRVETLQLPAPVTHIGTLAMSGMDSLNKIMASSVDAVPALGRDVWDRIDKSKVQLIVPDAIADDYRAAPQWQDFDIINDSVTGIDDGISTDKVAVRGRFDGYMLEIEAQGTDLAKIDIYDTMGRRILERKADSDRASVDCSHIADRLLIVLVTTADGRQATIKIIKNG